MYQGIIIIIMYENTQAVYGLIYVVLLYSLLYMTLNQLCNIYHIVKGGGWGSGT